MRLFVGALAVLLATVVITPQALAAKACTDGAGVAAALKAVDTACPCATASKPAKYIKCAKPSLASLKGSCKKQALKTLRQSLCGRPQASVICCQQKKNSFGSVKPTEAKCKKGTKCAALNNRDSVFDSAVAFRCATNGDCVVPPTTTSTTIVATTTSTTSTTTPVNRSCSADGAILRFDLGTPTGACGSYSGASGKIADINCGDLLIGGGVSTVPPGPTPPGATSFFALDCQADGECSICPTSPTGAFVNVGVTQQSCTDTGCFFGTPLPIVNGGVSTCVLNTFASGAGGHVNVKTGVTDDMSIVLMSHTFLTGIPEQPCPVCKLTNAGQIPSITNPQPGKCDRGARANLDCTTTNAQGLTQDCQPGGVGPGTPCTDGNPAGCADGSFPFTPFQVSLSPLSTDTVTKSASDGQFCPGQTGANTGKPGCFGSAACTSITLTGTPAGDLSGGDPKPGVSVAVFCIPAANDPSGLINAAADLPGPGATSLPGTYTVLNADKLP